MWSGHSQATPGIDVARRIPGCSAVGNESLAAVRRSANRQFLRDRNNLTFAEGGAVNGDSSKREGTQVCASDTSGSSSPRDSRSTSNMSNNWPFQSTSIRPSPPGPETTLTISPGGIVTVVRRPAEDWVTASVPMLSLKRFPVSIAMTCAIDEDFQHSMNATLARTSNLPGMFRALWVWSGQRARK